MANLLKKLSTKLIVGKIDRDSVPKKGVRPLFRVAGIASSILTGSGTLGDWIAFRGSFRAQVIDPALFETGTLLNSPKLFLPSLATDLLLPAVEQNMVQGGTGVEFGFDIGITAADNAVGYEYVVTPLVESKENDPIEVLFNSMPKLPAPKKVA